MVVVSVQWDPLSFLPDTDGLSTWGILQGEPILVIPKRAVLLTKIAQHTGRIRLGIPMISPELQAQHCMTKLAKLQQRGFGKRGRCGPGRGLLCVNIKATSYLFQAMLDLFLFFFNEVD